LGILFRNSSFLIISSSLNTSLPSLVLSSLFLFPISQLKKDDFISPTISTVEQYNLYTKCLNQLNLAHSDISIKSHLSTEISKLTARIEKHSDTLWLWSNTLILLLPKIVHFYTSTLSLNPNTVLDGYKWLLKHSGISNNKKNVAVQHHRGIKKSFCNGVISFCNKITSASIASTNKPNGTINNNDDNFFVDDSNTSIKNPLLSPIMLSTCNDLLFILLDRMNGSNKKIKNVTKVKNINESKDYFNIAIHPEEINVLVRACMAQKESKPRHRCVVLLISLWNHPNAFVRHSSLKGFYSLCKMKLKEIINLNIIDTTTNTNMNNEKNKKISLKTSTLAIQINQRLKERDCDDEDRQLLNVILKWYYSVTA